MLGNDAIQSEARQALQARVGGLRFWNRSQRAVSAADQALDRIDRLADQSHDEPARKTIALTRAARSTVSDDSRRLALLRESFKVLESGAAVASPLGAIAVRLLHAGNDAPQTAQALLECERRCESTPYLDYLRDLSKVSGPVWAVEASAQPPADAAAAAAQARSLLGAGAGAWSMALAHLPVMFPADEALRLQMRRLQDVERLQVPPAVQAAAQRLTVESIADQQPAQVEAAPAFAKRIMAVAGSPDAALGEWALHQVEAVPQAQPWLDFRATMSASVSAADKLRDATLAVVAERQPFTAQTATALAARVAAAEPTPQQQVGTARAAVQWLQRQNVFDLTLKAHFLDLAAALPFVKETDKSAALLAGLNSIGAGTPNGSEGLARQALRMAANTDAYVDKFRLANMALQQIELLTAHNGTPQQLQVVRTLRRMGEQEDAAMRGSSNRIWFRAAGTMQALQSTARLLRGSPGELVDIGLRWLDTPWASRPYLLAVGETLLTGIARVGGSQSIYDVCVAHARAAVSAAATDAERVAALRNGLTEMQRLEAGGFQRAFAQAVKGRAGEQPRIEQETDYVIINGVKVPRASAAAPTVVPEPLPQEVEVPAMPPPSSEDFSQLLLPRYTADAVEQSASGESRIQRNASYKSGVAAVYNPLSGDIEEKESYKSGVGGVFNPNTGKVEWKDSYKSGVGGAYNPRTGEVAWKVDYHCGVGLTYNPASATVESKSSYKCGVFGVFNPNSRQVEWRESYKEGVAGYWDQKEDKVTWRSEYKDGVAVVNTDPTCPTLSSGSIGWWDDDD